MVIGVEDEGNGERRYTVAVEGPSGADERVDIFTIEDFVAPEPAPVQTPEPAAAETPESAAAPTDAEASAPEQDTPVLTPPVTPPALPSALERMPTTTDRRGRQTIDWTGADPALAWEAFVEQSGGDAEVARGAVDNMLRGAKNALKAAKKTKATDDVDRAIANETKRQTAIAEATRVVAAWEAIAAVGQHAAKSDQRKETPESIDKTTDTGDNPTDLRGGTALSQNSGVSERKDSDSSEEKQEVGGESSAALPRMPRRRTAKGKEVIDWGGAETALAWDALVETAGGDAELAQSLAEKRLAAAEKALAAAKKANVNGDEDFEGYIAAFKEAERMVDVWKAIAGENARRAEAARTAELEAAEEERRRAAAAEEERRRQSAETEALENDIPEWQHDDPGESACPRRTTPRRRDISSSGTRRGCARQGGGHKVHQQRHSRRAGNGDRRLAAAAVASSRRAQSYVLYRRGTAQRTHRSGLHRRLPPHCHRDTPRGDYKYRYGLHRRARNQLAW